MNKSVLVGLIVAIVIAVGVGGYIYYSGQGIGATTVPGDISEPAAAVPTVAPDEKFIGKADAPVTMVEYFSLGCIHCKNFHENILPQLKTEYIDTGKVRLVFRDFPLDGLSFAAAGLTRCVNDLAYSAMVDTLFKEQETWHVQNGASQLATIARSAGMDQAAFDACIKDEARNAKILAMQKEGSETYKVDSTPTFFINDRKLSGAGDYAPFKAAIENALARAQ